MKRVLVFALPLAILTAAAAPAQESRLNLRKVVKGNTEFAFDAYVRMADNDNNIFFSPYSVSTAMAMTHAGAGGDTAAEIATAMRFTLPPERLHAGFGRLMKEVPGDGKAYEFTTANALWAQKGSPIKDDFAKLTREKFGAGLEQVDFNDRAAAAKTINAWVEKETKDTIKDLIKPSILDGNTRLVLTNAVYFKGAWETPFNKELTKKDTFRTPSGKDVDVSMMHRQGKFKYYEARNFQVLELPYKGKDLSMVILLPTTLEGLRNHERSLSPDNFDLWGTKSSEKELKVWIPRFKATSEMSLKETLGGMGLRRAFTPSADFSGINGGKEQLYLVDVVHKAFVEVNEVGTEAGAATGVVAKTKSEPGQPIQEFRADHPFLFLIRDNRSDAILFLGRVMDPTK